MRRRGRRTASPTELADRAQDGRAADLPRHDGSYSISWSDEDDGPEARLRVRLGESDTNKDYLRRIGKFPLLSDERAVGLGKRIEAGLLAEERLLSNPPPALSELTTELYLLAQQGRVAFRALVEGNLRLVVSLAKRFSGRGVLYLDLVQEGNIALIQAAQEWDFQSGVRFAEHARPMIREALRAALSDREVVARQDQLSLEYLVDIGLDQLVVDQFDVPVEELALQDIKRQGGSYPFLSLVADHPGPAIDQRAAVERPVSQEGSWIDVEETESDAEHESGLGDEQHGATSQGGDGTSRSESYQVLIESIKHHLDGIRREAVELGRLVSLRSSSPLSRIDASEVRYQLLRDAAQVAHLASSVPDSEAQLRVVAERLGKRAAQVSAGLKTLNLDHLPPGPRRLFRAPLSEYPAQAALLPARILPSTATGPRSDWYYMSPLDSK